MTDTVQMFRANDDDMETIMAWAIEDTGKSPARLLYEMAVYRRKSNPKLSSANVAFVSNDLTGWSDVERTEWVPLGALRKGVPVRMLKDKPLVQVEVRVALKVGSKVSIEPSRSMMAEFEPKMKMEPKVKEQVRMLAEFDMKPQLRGDPPVEELTLLKLVRLPDRDDLLWMRQT